MSFNPVTRVDPNRMERVTRSVMVGAHVRGNQSSAYRRSGRPSAPTLRLPPDVVKQLNKRQQRAEESVEWAPTEQIADAEHAFVRCSLPLGQALVRGERVELQVLPDDAFDIEWRAAAVPTAEEEQAAADERVVSAGRRRRIDDEPVVDTRYDVAFKQVVGRYFPRVIGRRFWLAIAVRDRPGEPSVELNLQVAQPVRFVSENCLELQLVVTNATPATAAAQNVRVDVTLPPNAFYDLVETRRRAPHDAWTFSDEQNVATQWIERIDERHTLTLCVRLAQAPEETPTNARHFVLRAGADNAPRAAQLQHQF